MNYQSLKELAEDSNTQQLLLSTINNLEDISLIEFVQINNMPIKTYYETIAADFKQRSNEVVNEITNVLPRELKRFLEVEDGGYRYTLNVEFNRNTDNVAFKNFIRLHIICLYGSVSMRYSFDTKDLLLQAYGLHDKHKEMWYGSKLALLALFENIK